MSETAAALLGLLVVPVLVALAWRGWRARARAQHAVTAPARPATGPGPDALPGTYVSTCRAGDWLDRVVVHGLGVRSAVLVEVDERGVALHRTGAPSLLLPAADLTGVRREPGMAGKYVGTRGPAAGGLVVLSWRLPAGDGADSADGADGAAAATDLDTGVRTRYAADADALHAAVQALLARRAA